MTVEEIRLALQVIPQMFPRLRHEPFQVKSPRTIKYNCIGYAADDEDHVWWPGGKYWPGGVQRDDSVPAFVAAFATRGYECCDSDAIEPGFEKVVLYVDEQYGRVTHAARQLTDGRWTSKLGPQWDINHLLEGVCGPHPAYGRVAQILRRPLPSLKVSAG
jgi:hypothetical protein